MQSIIAANLARARSFEESEGDSAANDPPRPANRTRQSFSFFLNGIAFGGSLRESRRRTSSASDDANDNDSQGSSPPTSTDASASPSTGWRALLPFRMGPRRSYSEGSVGHSGRSSLGGADSDGTTASSVDSTPAGPRRLRSETAPANGSRPSSRGSGRGTPLRRSVVQHEEDETAWIHVEPTMTHGPITDICVLLPESEPTPPGFQVLTRTPMGYSANLNKGSGDRVFVGFRREAGVRPITDVQIVCPETEGCPENYTLVLRTPGGRSANLNHGSLGRPMYLAFTRDTSNASIEELAIMVSSKGEAVPRGFTQIERSTNYGKLSVSKHRVHLCLFRGRRGDDASGDDVGGSTGAMHKLPAYDELDVTDASPRVRRDGLPTYDEVLQDGPSAEYYGTKGSESYRRGDFASAVRYYSAGIELDPGNHKIFSNRAAAYQQLGELQRAWQDAQKTIELKPSWFKGHFRLGAVLEKMNRLEDALEAYNAALSLEPTNSDLKACAWSVSLKVANQLRERGNVSYYQRRYDDAARLYTASIRLDSSNHVVYSNRAAAFYQLGEFQRAVVDTDSCIELNSQFLKAYIRKGRALEALGRHQQAVDAFMSGLQIEPHDDALLACLRKLERTSLVTANGGTSSSR
eukprot:Opistho-2@44853